MVVTEKFSQNEEIRKKLISTGNATLIEATQDAYWGPRD